MQHPTIQRQQPYRHPATARFLVRQLDAVRERTLEITFAEPGAKAYAFTFG